MNRNLVKGLVCIAIPVAVLLTPVPPGLTLLAWQLLAVYLGAVLGLMLKPVPEPVVLLTALAVTALCFKQIATALSGFAETVPWLVFAAFIIGQCFVETGLGSRISYLLIGKLGRTSLGLGYVAAISDLVLAPATPSNTARTGGLIFPIFQSLAVTLDSTPGPTARRIGSYFMVLLYQISLVTATMFITAGAIHPMNLAFAKNIMNADVSWMQWAVAMFIPGILTLMIIPYLVYKIYPPEIKVVDNKAIAAKGFEKLGLMTANEKKLAFLFLLAIIGWATGTITKLDPSGIAIGFVAVSLLIGVITWHKVLECKSAWSTFIWYAGIISLANGLNKAGFFVWLGKVLAQNVNFVGMNKIGVMIGLVLMGVVVRYLFASTAAFVATFVPVLYTLGMVAELPVIPLVLLVGASSQIASLMTHYGNAVGPILFGPGYVDQATWWKIGHIVTVVALTIYVGVGLSWWKVMGLW
ncbi:MAG: DASS family sodium-coupled anion symporter [Negativicutes bacterium]|nr:DASS family sodium-coupled anion symporter [Negativicutes bacterium]